MLLSLLYKHLTHFYTIHSISHILIHVSQLAWCPRSLFSLCGVHEDSGQRYAWQLSHAATEAYRYQVDYLDKYAFGITFVLVSLALTIIVS